MTKTEQQLLKKLNKLQKEYDHMSDLYNYMEKQLEKEQSEVQKLRETLEPLVKRNNEVDVYIAQLKGTMKWMVNCI